MLCFNPIVLEDLKRGQSRPGNGWVLIPGHQLRLLRPKDRLLMELASSKTMTRRQIGQAVGLTAGTVSRKFRRLLRRLRDPLIQALADPKCPLAPTPRLLGIEYFLYRTPAAILARQHHLSQRKVVSMLHFVRGWHRGLTQQQGMKAEG